MPRPLGVLVLLMLFVPLFFSGGTYLSNINEMAGGMGVLTENFQFLSLCASIGMSMVFPFMLPYLQARNVKHVYLGGYILLALLNGVCAIVQSIPLLAVCCFLIGFIRVALVLNTTFVIAPYLLGIFRYRYTWYGIGIFLLLMLVNSSTLFVTTYLKMSTASGNLESAAVSCWAIPGCVAGLVFMLVCVFRGVHFRYIYAAGFLLMLGANLYMYFHYQTMGVYGHIIPPTLLHYSGMLVLYSVTCAFAMKHLPVRYFATWLFLMVAVRNVAAPAVGTSVYGNWLQERQQHYITRLAQDVRSDSPQFAARFMQASRLGKQQGKDEVEASRLASVLMKGQVSLQATLVAMKDITGSTIWICLGSTFAVLLMPYHRKERT